MTRYTTNIKRANGKRSNTRPVSNDHRSTWSIARLTRRFLVKGVNGANADAIPFVRLRRAYLLDLMLPDGSGLDLCRELKSDPKKNLTPIIILTAKDDEVDRVVGFELGADDYVTKPFSVRELILRVKAVLKRGNVKSENLEVQRQFGDLVIDVDSHEVFVNNDQVILTALEFKLLRQLVDRRGRVQSRDQLLSDVWGYSADVTTRTVDTHIKRLREKLGAMGKYVQTIRGVGYKFSRTPE